MDRADLSELARQYARKYNPEGSALRRDQKELVRMLCFVADICEKNNITWWLSSGSLLGAARHEGFIPWDDDLDIVMMRKDCLKLEKILHELDSDEFFYQSIRSDVEYTNAFGKFRKKEGRIQTKNRRTPNYKYGGIGFDIFSIEKTSHFAAHAAKFLYTNLQHPTLYIKNRRIRRFMIRFVQLINFGFFIPVLRLVGKINPRGEYHYELGTAFHRSTFFYKDIFPLATAKFEGKEFPVPNDTDAYLTRVYGDWRKMPSEEEIRASIHCREYVQEIYGNDIQ